MLIRRHRAKPGTTEVVLDVPSGSASKADWLAFALAVGATEEDVAGLTRDQLREQYTPKPNLFDPGEHEPAEVLAYLTGLDGTDPAVHDAEVVRVVEAEKAGKNRAEVLEQIGGMPAPTGEQKPPVE
ncbi:hypothetical protein [Oerskovia enterophila]|uniref:Uncharacterized protein n=1 Tax=Oerskovia enterophila TaxID=43678 RepID=A0A163QUC0_9CELL|nr:hypothetical protein [Oerskovia enterophila]KZM34541.1 hypothetical protein OJAG_28400 [Oerskovia enterophila]